MPKFGIPKKYKRKYWIHLISHKASIVIGQPVDLTMLSCMNMGTIPSKAIFLPIQHLLNMSRCDFCGQNSHAIKLTSIKKMSRCDFGGMIILPAKITSTQFEYMIHNCQQDCFARDCTYIHRIKQQWVYRLRYHKISFWAGEKNRHVGNVFQLMKLKELMMGEDSEPEETCSQLGGTHFRIGKIKFRWKLRSSKGPVSE